MRAADVMTRNVATVPPTIPVWTIAQLPLDHGISAVPVIGPKRELLGVVSEGDLLHRAELSTLPRRAWWLSLFSNPEDEARQFVRTRGLVELGGLIESQAQRDAVDLVARSVSGVAEVSDHLSIRPRVSSPL